MSIFRRFEFVKDGVKKYYDWGYSIVYMPDPSDCFSELEIDEVLVKLAALPQDSLKQKEVLLFASLKKKRARETV